MVATQINTVSQTELVELLAARAKSGCFALTIETRTDARLKKTGNTFGPVYKLSRVNGMANWHYGRSVNRQRTREELTADFEAAPRQWGERIEGTPFVQHKGRTYLELKVERSLGHSYQTEAGETLTDSDVAPFLPAKADASRQGVERTVILRDYAIDSILAVVMDGTRYLIGFDTLAMPTAEPLPAAGIVAA